MLVLTSILIIYVYICVHMYNYYKIENINNINNELIRLSQSTEIS